MLRNALLILLSCQVKPTPTKQLNMWHKCDRGNPCSICTATCSDCLQGDFMTYVFGTKRLSRPLAFQPPISSGEEVTRFTSASHIGQNQDGTWTSMQHIQSYGQWPKKRKAEEPLMRLTRRRALPQVTALQKIRSVSNLLEDATDTIDAEIDAGKTSSPYAVIAPRPGSQKHKSGDVDNEEFLPTLNGPNIGTQEGNSFAATPMRSLKRKMAPNKPVGSTKYHRSMQEDKPVPCGQPPVWADKRQSLCETLPYYKAYMSGAYMHLQMVRAFMVDKEVGPRDKFEEEIMISRV